MNVQLSKNKKIWPHRVEVSLPPGVELFLSSLGVFYFSRRDFLCNGEAMDQLTDDLKAIQRHLQKQKRTARQQRNAAYAKGATAQVRAFHNEYLVLTRQKTVVDELIKVAP